MSITSIVLLSSWGALFLVGMFLQVTCDRTLGKILGKERLQEMRFRSAMTALFLNPWLFFPFALLVPLNSFALFEGWHGAIRILFESYVISYRHVLVREDFDKISEYFGYEYPKRRRD